MHTKISVFLWLPWVILCLFTCKKDDNQTGDYPRLSTVSVSNINQTGADFSGSFMQSGIDAIVDHGFVYGMAISPTLSNAETISLGSSTGNGNFSARVTSAMETNQSYYVSAFAKTSKNVYYSDPVSFTSLGSSAPVITTVMPVKSIVGDTIIIRGHNFSRRTEGNAVQFNLQEANVLLTTDTVIKVRVPSSKGIEIVEISVKTAGQTVTNRSFSYLKPEIIDFWPKTGIYLDTIYVKERNYSGKNITPTFMFGDVQADIILASDSVYKIVVPSSKGNEKQQVSALVDGITSIADESFTYRIPIVTKIEPAEGIYGDIVHIKGKDFGHQPSKVKIQFGGKDALMIAATDSVLTVIAPMVDAGIENATAIAIVDERTVTCPRQFRYQKPVIFSFEPQSACGGDSVVIRGQYLLSTNQLSASFGPYKVEKFGKVRNNEIRAVIPKSEGNEDVSISVNNNGLVGSSTGKFRYLKPAITGITPDKGFKYDQVTISGQNFGKDPKNIAVLFDDEKAIILEHQSTKIVVSVPVFSGNKLSEIKILRDGFTATSNTKFQYIEPVISGFQPSSGRVGTTITINGQYFTNNESNVKVYCGDFQLDIESCSDNQLVVSIPNTAAFTKQPIRVSVDGNEGSSISSFEIISPWTKKAALPIFTSHPIACTYKDEGYFALGSSRDCWKYNPANDHWQLITDNWDRNYRTEPVFFQIGEYWYWGGGAGIDNNLYQITLESFQSEAVSKLPQQQGSTAFHGTFSFIIDNKAYVCGGNGSNSVWQFDSQVNKWTRKTSLPGVGRNLGIAFSYNGKGYAGCGIYENSYNDLFEYDPQDDTWTRKNDFPYGGIWGAIAFTINNRIFVGLGSSFVAPIRDIWEYNPASDSWSHVAIIPNYGGPGAFVFVINNKGYIGGGYNNRDFYEFDSSKL